MPLLYNDPDKNHVMNTGQMIEHKYNKNKFKICCGDQLQYANGGLQFQISSVTNNDSEKITLKVEKC